MAPGYKEWGYPATFLQGIAIQEFFSVGILLTSNGWATSFKKNYRVAYLAILIIVANLTHWTFQLMILDCWFKTMFIPTPMPTVLVTLIQQNHVVSAIFEMITNIFVVCLAAMRLASFVKSDGPLLYVIRTAVAVEILVAIIVISLAPSCLADYFNYASHPLYPSWNALLIVAWALSAVINVSAAVATFLESRPNTTLSGKDVLGKNLLKADGFRLFVIIVLNLNLVCCVIVNAIQPQPDWIQNTFNCSCWLAFCEMHMYLRSWQQQAMGSGGTVDTSHNNSLSQIRSAPKPKSSNRPQE